jgi:hypothetical protein
MSYSSLKRKPGRNCRVGSLSSGWVAQTPRITENIVEQIVKRVFIDEEHIYPCVDLGVGDLLEDGSLLIVGNVSGHAPRPFGQNWTGA